MKLKRFDEQSNGELCIENTIEPVSLTPRRILCYNNYVSDFRWIEYDLDYILYKTRNVSINRIFKILDNIGGIK
jgi:hypothetical protein